MENPNFPKPPSCSGRTGTGQFAPGNKVGVGDPHRRAVNKLRAAMLKAVTPEDVAAIVRKLIELAKAGDVHAAREVLDRVLGKATVAVEAEGAVVGAIQVVYSDDWYGSWKARNGANGDE